MTDRKPEATAERVVWVVERPDAPSAVPVCAHVMRDAADACHRISRPGHKLVRYVPAEQRGLDLGRADASKLLAAARDLAKMVVENGYESALRRAAARVLYLTKG